MTLPAPLTPSDCDLRDIDGFLLNVERLMASELAAIATGDEFKAAVILWCRAWKQVPAASLPDDDRILAAFAGVTQAKWAKIKRMALRGFIKCLDGRLYHPVLAGDAVKTKGRKEAFKVRRETDAKRLREWRSSHKGNGSETDHETRNETKSETRFVAEVPVPVPVPVPKPSSSSEKLGSASAPELPLDRLIRVMKLDHEALRRRPQFQGFAGFLHEWKLAGCDVERDVWPAIERVSARQRDIASPKYFEAAIFKARDDRIASQPSEAERWATRVEAFRVSGFWPTDPPPVGFGPKPGQPGCLCPPELLIGVAA